MLVVLARIERLARQADPPISLAQLVTSGRYGHRLGPLEA